MSVLKCWYDRALRRLRCLRRGGNQPRLRSIRTGYLKAGQAVHDEPIPWNAEAVLVEAVLEWPDDLVWEQREFTLAVPGQPYETAAEVRADETEQVLHVRFRLSPPQGTTAALLSWRARRLGQLVLTHLSAEEFLQGLRLEGVTVFARLGDHHVAARTLVAGQCGGLSACGVLKSPCSLLPVVDLGLTLECTDRRTGLSRCLPVDLLGCQLAAREALLSALPGPGPWPVGTWALRWTVAGRPLAGAEVRVLPEREFRQSLSVADGHAVCEGRHRSAARLPHLYGQEARSSPRPSFLLSSREPGLAAFCPVEVKMRRKDGTCLPGVVRQQVLVTDVATPLILNQVPLEDLHQVDRFELSSNGQLLGVVPNGTPPVAGFTSEGGYVSPEEYPWTARAEAELEEHLSRLLAAGRNEASMPWGAFP